MYERHKLGHHLVLYFLPLPFEIIVSYTNSSQCFLTLISTLLVEVIDCLLVRVCIDSTKLIHGRLDPVRCFRHPA